MSYIKRKRKFHPSLSVLYVLTYIAATIYTLYSLNYSTNLHLSFILKPLFPEGLIIPVFISVLILAGAVSLIVYFMQDIMVKRFELNRKNNLHYFVLPLILLTSPGIIETSINAMFIAICALTLSFVLSMAISQSDTKKTFISGFLAGIFFLFSDSAAVLLLLFPLLLFTNRIFSVRAVLVYGFAFILPLLYLLTYLYLIDFNIWPEFLKNSELRFMKYEHLLKLVNGYVLAFLIVLLIMISARVHFKLSEYKISIRRAFSSTLLFILVFIPSIIFMPEIHSLTYLSSLIFISLFYYMRMVSDVKKKGLSAVIYMLPVIIYLANIFLKEYSLSLFY
ncbi:MAG: hypothetical protein JXR53_02770 [Bacteroidales bacterium]|nr:hypothetical protein [Bacteroidales bacterium]